MTAHPGSTAADELQDLLLTSADLTGFLQDFTRSTAARLVQDGDEMWCTVTLLRDRRPATVASSARRAAALDEVQYRFSEGPCLTAAREHVVVSIPDVLEDPRWPGYGRIAAQEGVRSVLAVPFDLGGDGCAALNLYAPRAHAHDEDAVAAVCREVLVASRALRLAVRVSRHREAETDLAAAMASRTVIDLAVGIVMGQNRCTQEEAFAVLKAASSHRNVKLRRLAADLVATVGEGRPATHVEA
ncbi:GAF and ANTAR domain-containing protein [Kocuria sp. M1R5S2]|uniref:GAF and ANTAR domain-containing protein n=1 Tax=Kocuria rhizosphaerae TaxID=3376285 RepID=UPI0037A258C6